MSDPVCVCVLPDVWDAVIVTVVSLCDLTYVASSTQALKHERDREPSP